MEKLFGFEMMALLQSLIQKFSTSSRNQLIDSITIRNFFTNPGRTGNSPICIDIMIASTDPLDRMWFYFCSRLTERTQVFDTKDIVRRSHFINMARSPS